MELEIPHETVVRFLAVWSLTAAAYSKPNFSDDWKMNPGTLTDALHILTPQGKIGATYMSERQ